MLAGRAAVVQVNTEENQRVASRFGVTGIPVLYLLKQGKVVDSLAGAQPVDSVIAWFRRNEHD
jgi:thioredoxin-like negative regulator of GroEL